MTPTLNYRKRWITLDSGDKRYLGDDGALKEGEWFLISGKDSRDADYNYWYYAGSDGNVVMDKWWIFLCGSTAVPEERIPPIQRQETAVPEQRYRT